MYPLQGLKGLPAVRKQCAESCSALLPRMTYGR